MNNQEREERIEAWVEEHREVWAANGAKYQSWRTSLNIGITQAARDLGVGTGTLRNFEAGAPVMRAKLLSRAYGYYLERMEDKLLEAADEARSTVHRLRGDRRIY